MGTQQTTPTEQDFFLPNKVLPHLCQETIIEDGFHKVELEQALLLNSALAGLIYSVAKYESYRLKNRAIDRFNSAKEQLDNLLASGSITQEQHVQQLLVETYECANADIAYCCPLVTGNVKHIECALFNAEFKFLRLDEVQTDSIFYFGRSISYEGKLANQTCQLGASEILAFSRNPANIEALSSKDRYELLFNLMQGMDFIGTTSVELLSKALAEQFTTKAVDQSL